MTEISEKIFVGVVPTGIAYSDKTREVDGDYAKLAHLRFSDLELNLYPGCSAAMAEFIKANAAEIQAKAGEEFRISSSGQTITLGHTLPPIDLGHNP